MRIQGAADKAHVKAHGAAHTALGLLFHTLGALEPVLHVVIPIHKGNAQLFTKADIFVLADFVFFFWMDIGVVEKHGEVNTAIHHALHQVASTRGAAGMEEDFIAVTRWD